MHVVHREIFFEPAVATFNGCSFVVEFSPTSCVSVRTRVAPDILGDALFNHYSVVGLRASRNPKRAVNLAYSMWARLTAHRNHERFHNSSPVISGVHHHEFESPVAFMVSIINGIAISPSYTLAGVTSRATGISQLDRPFSH
jgi:hypothetical protein